jgi:hypothetical protein
LSTIVPINADAFHAAVTKALQKEVDHVLDGRCASFEDYRHRAGQIKGYRSALQHFADALKADDDDE